MFLFCIWKSYDLSKISLVCYFRLAKCLVARFLISDASVRVSSACLKYIDLGWLLFFHLDEKLYLGLRKLSVKTVSRHPFLQIDNKEEEKGSKWFQ